MNVENIWKNEEKILNATGMTKVEAENLIPSFTIELNKSNKGRPTKLNDQGVFLLMMLYYRHYPTYELLGLMFEIDSSNAKRWIDRAETAFRTVLSKKKLLPLNTSGSSEEIKKTLERQRKIYVDGTEQAIRRPKDKVEQRENYSGKKKRHTSKLLVVSDEDKYIKVISPVYVGSSHDFSIFKDENLIDALPSKTPVYLDTGFEGIKALRDDINIRKPKKKTRSRKLNGGEKLGNRIISSERVKVEHAIGGLKRMRIVNAVFRGIHRSMDLTVEIACGIWNYIVTRRTKRLVKLNS